jgi:GWxTD domain-containing protein
MNPCLRALALFLAWAAFAAATTLPELLQKAKDEFRSEKYAEALQTLDELDAQTRGPGFEKDHAALEPVLAFYRGASFAALGRKEEAKAQFLAFLRFQPNAALDPSMYPKKVIAVFEDARKSGQAEPPSASIAAAYRTFIGPSVPGDEISRDVWTAGPVRFLLTSSEKQDFEQRSDARSRSEFVTTFWKVRDPKLETPENEFRQEFEKRVAFADAQFSQGETRGSLADRGMVFLLLGPPTYIGRKPLSSGSDAISRPRSDSGAPGTLYSGKPGAQTVTKRSEDRNWLEVWHYRKENLPSGVPYQQVDFEFLTKRGYGENVLQRDSQTLDTLERAKPLVRKQ